jgi:hypothetical protein
MMRVLVLVSGAALEAIRTRRVVSVCSAHDYRDDLDDVAVYLQTQPNDEHRQYVSGSS